MNFSSLIDFSIFAELLTCLFGLASIAYSGQAKRYRYLCALLSTRVSLIAIGLPITKLAGRLISARLAYDLYFYIYWSSFALESVLTLMIIYSLYKVAMDPLKGLQALGMLMFKWVGAVSLVLATVMAIGPRISGMKFLMIAVTHFQRTQSILTLCMLLFVCFAIRPMGLSYRSRVFGVSLGLGVMATTDLIRSAWLAPETPMYSAINVLSGIGVCLALLIWAGYFAMPEPARKILVLPTTSPFLRWNQISMALGDDPGFVAIGGIPPDIFAPAELEIMKRASAKMIDPHSMQALSRIA